ncbi:MAG: hypothetical protein ACE5NG_14190 [bacterium]
MVLNQYYDGQSDWGTDGNVIPELLAWLEEDLAANNKKHIFVFCGHCHSASYSKINGLWQIDAGHARGIEDKLYPQQLFEALIEALKEGSNTAWVSKNRLRNTIRRTPKRFIDGLNT